MENIIPNIETELQTITDLKYVGKDWGQLDDPNTIIVVDYPLALVDIKEADFENLGWEKAENSGVRRKIQTAEIDVVIRIANKSSALVTSWNVMDQIHAQLQGFAPTTETKNLIRSSVKRVNREDDIQEYEIIYSLGATNI